MKPTRWILGFGMVLATGCSDSGSQAIASLVQITAEPAGSNCAAGGQRIETGPDSNADGSLTGAEIVRTVYVCNGTSGATGTAALVKTASEPAGANCASGGQRVDYGNDDDANGVLATAEIDGTAYVCAGAPGTTGLTSLVAITAEPAGTNCGTGGQRIDAGVDDDGNGTLDVAEIDATSYVCNGATGPAGHASLIDVAIEPTGTNCGTGGRRFSYGLDQNDNSTLDSSEVLGTSYVCNGTGGLSSLILTSALASGAICANGGQRIDYGLDDDGNGVLAMGEIDGTSYVCNGSAPAHLNIALEAPVGCAVTNTGNSYPTAKALLEARGHTVTIVDGSGIDTLAEASAFDVIVFPGWCITPQGSDYAVFDGILTDYVNGGGGVVATGWALYASSTIGTQLVTLLPTARGDGYLGANVAVDPVPGSPITNLLGSFTSAADYLPYGGATKPGATVLARSGSTDVAAAWQVLRGRATFVGLLSVSDVTNYNSAGLLDGSQPNATEFFLRSIEWTGGAF